MQSIAGCVLHQPTSIPTFVGDLVHSRMCNIGVKNASSELQGLLSTAAGGLKCRCDGTALLPLNEKSKRIIRVMMEGVKCLRCPSTLMAFLGLYEEHEAARGGD